MLSRTAPLSTAGSAPALPTAGTGRNWIAILMALCIWSGVGLLLGYGALHGWGKRELHPPAPLTPPAPLAVDLAAVGRALGVNTDTPIVATTPTVVSTPARYTLVGVMAVGRDGQAGVALIATDGQKAKPYKIGATIDGRWQVQSISARSVVLHPLPSVVQSESQNPMHLQLPAPPALSASGSAPPAMPAGIPPSMTPPPQANVPTPTQ